MTAEDVIETTTGAAVAAVAILVEAETLHVGMQIEAARIAADRGMAQLRKSAGL